ncbi:CAP domain-containing protein [Mycobacterium sp. CVI_P3]|uniref:CAP domain-containing protein n=2 Tax=Mycobacterium pinniadriaticum TaxID=2994102 RepID=A0ABT3SLW2_9MYCO|nr:CAP domain-containing protein [Mycobacterium pinniadriaticum]MCX2934074.1 CAP domain-containing protein [Mycobacterium pinniadriaticum]MCX2940496.1 CAP domain-containing protein [Mycobacterium pinniadriaticum]
MAAALLGATAILLGAPTARADNISLNKSVVKMVHALQYQAGCRTSLKVNPRLQLAAQWHTIDVLNNRALDGDVGSDGSSPQGRSAAAGFRGKVAETVAINPALAISGMELINRWYYNPDYLAIIQNCANTEIGVWSENSLDRTVVVAVYGQPEAPGTDSGG